MSAIGGVLKTGYTMGQTPKIDRATWAFTKFDMGHRV